MIIIIGGGVAGLMGALAASPHPVMLLNAGELGAGAASALAQGGLSAAVGPADSVALHVADTLAAGAGLCDRAAVQRIVGAGPRLVETLRGYGVQFDTVNGELALGLEAAHTRSRIVHATGDQTGAEIVRALIARVRRTPSITVVDATALRVVTDDAGVVGVLVRIGDRLEVLAADRVMIATGGIGGLFQHTTNPAGAIGHGLMIAQGAHAALKHLEFIQFHPTALDVAGTSLPLISEAVRGEGARFIDETGSYFMHGADLAPRDVVARALFAHQAVGHSAWLDARSIGTRFATRFPGIHAICARAGIDPTHELIPVRPAAHYHMGGVAVDSFGRTSIDGLYAAGEVACTGLHGANRLASNSLLEAAVCGADAGRHMAGLTARRLRTPFAVTPGAAPDVQPLREMMSAELGVVRTTAGLARAAQYFSGLAAGNPAARLCSSIAEAAMSRRQSVGAHSLADLMTRAA